MAIIYIDEEKGLDADTTDGSESSPFKSLTQAYLRNGPESEYRVKKINDDFKPAAKAALKKAANYASRQRKKDKDASTRSEMEAQRESARQAVLEKAKNIKITEDPALPKAVLIDIAEADPKVIGQLRKNENEPKEGVRRVRVQGRVNRVAKQ